VTLKDQVIAALKRVYDPELPLNIYDMGLIYNVEAGEDGKVAIRMTLTTPSCPVAGELLGSVERAARAVAGVTDVKVELTFDPPWGPEKLSEAAQLAMGIDGIVPIARIRR
jgi:FeS assembly SUF system protein